MSLFALPLVLILVVGCAATGASVTPLPPASHATATLLPLAATSVLPTSTASLMLPLTGSGGGRIAFASRRGEGDYEIYVMNADGTDQRQVTRDAFESGLPVWSPDGTQIAFTLDTFTGQTDIYVVDADGSNLRRLMARGGADPAWEPTDGTQIAFSLYYPRGGADIYVMNVADTLQDAGGSNQQPLTHVSEGLAAFDPGWSPDGTQIVCVVDSDPDPVAEESTICVLNVRESLQKGGADSADLRPLPRAGKNLNNKPAWSPDGSRIAFSAEVEDHRGIYVVNADGTNLRRLTLTQDYDEFAPAWSPDGKRIVFQANPDNNWDIFVMNDDGSGRRRLTTDVANDVTPDWAP